jgi:hypothetical protein
MLNENEKSEFEKLRKKFDHYWHSVLVPFDQSLVEIDPIAKTTALDDFFQEQSDFKPTDEEITKLKLLAHKDPQYDPLLPGDLLLIEEIENQIMLRLRPSP